MYFYYVFLYDRQFNDNQLKSLTNLTYFLLNFNFLNMKKISKASFHNIKKKLKFEMVVGSIMIKHILNMTTFMQSRQEEKHSITQPMFEHIKQLKQQKEKINALIEDAEQQIRDAPMHLEELYEEMSCSGCNYCEEGRNQKVLGLLNNEKLIELGITIEQEKILELTIQTQLKEWQKQKWMEKEKQIITQEMFGFINDLKQNEEKINAEIKEHEQIIHDVEIQCNGHAY